MVDGLARIPDNPDTLYDARDSIHIPLSLPFNQGDVFRDVPVPAVLGGGSGHAMLLMHPCTMREGVALRDVQTVILVTEKSLRKVLGPDNWNKWLKVMPLPDLNNDHHSTRLGDFMSIWSVAASDVPRSQRVAQLSHQGRLILQQRLICHFSRYAPDLREVDRATRPVSEEILLQGDWVVAALSALQLDRPGMAMIESLESLFDAFMRQRPSDSAYSVREMLSIDRERREAHSLCHAQIERFPEGLEAVTGDVPGNRALVIGATPEGPPPADSPKPTS